VCDAKAFEQLAKKFLMPLSIGSLSNSNLGKATFPGYLSPLIFVEVYMKVALVHDYLTQRGGAERVFELLCKCFPNADIFTSLYDAESTIDLGDRHVHTTFLQKIPAASKYFRLLAPLYYPAFRMLDLQDYALIISSSSSFAKGVRKRPGAQHICFCHNITRFLWDTQVYLHGYKEFQLFSPVIEKVFTYLRRLDVQYSKEPDLYIANSTTVANRIGDIYDKPAITINYPIDDSKFIFADRKEDFYLVCCRLLSYKRVDIIVDAFNSLGWPLMIAGNGPEYQRLAKKARENIRFLGYVSDRERTQLMAKARGVIVAALEDYGLVPIEANFSGTPAIAYGAGGVLDTQVPGVTGIFFDRQTPEAVRDAVVRASQMEWNYARIRNHALDRFTEAVFFEQVAELLDLTQSGNSRDSERRWLAANALPIADDVPMSASAQVANYDQSAPEDSDLVVRNPAVAVSSPADGDYCQIFDSNEVSMAPKVLQSLPEDDSVSYGQIVDDDRPVKMASKTIASSPEEDSGYGQMFAVLLRRKYWVLASLLGAVGVALLLTMHQKPNYRSSMQLLVDQNYRGKTEQGDNNPQFADSDVQVDYTTQLTLMNSSIVIQRIVDRLHPIYPNLTIDDVKKSLSVVQVTGKTAEKKVDTKIFEAAYEDRDPVRAQKILQTVQQVYQDYNKEQQQLRLSRGLEFLNEQVPQIQDRVKQSESALENFRKTQNFLNPELQSTALVESLNKISQEQRTNLVQIEDFRTRYKFLEQKLALSPQTIAMATRLSQSVRYQNLLNEIQKTELALLQDRLRYTDESSIVQNSIERRRQLQSQLSREMQRILPAGVQSDGATTAADVITAGQLGAVDLNLASQFIDAQANLNVALARQKSLAQIEQKYQHQIQQFPALLSEYNRLQPAVESDRQTLQRLLKARQDLGLEIARGGFAWQMVEEPKLGIKTGPDLKRNLLLGGVIGLFLGGAIAFVREAIDDSIHSLAELTQQARLPVLGAVPEILPPKNTQPGLMLPFRRRSSFAPSTLQLISWQPFRESIDLVCQNIEMLESSKFLKSLVITSILPGEGKSTLAIGLAISAARLHKRVLLIDADFRCASLHTQLNLANDRGLSTLLTSEANIPADKVIQSLSANANLAVLTAGPTPLDPAQLLSLRRMAELMVEFEANYDLVIVDAPPLLGIVDTVMVASVCSGVVLVERIGRVNRKDLNQAATVLNRLNVVGLIPNGVHSSEHRYAANRQGMYLPSNF
jgi:polysaccharide biosynthesis transport protein